MSAIFISHSSKDNAVAAEFKVRLEEQGHRSIFLDFDPEVGIPAGRNWEKELYSRLRGCQAVIVLCSEHSMASSWCISEITQARALGKHLFPLKVATCQISPLLADVQVTDLTLNPIEGYQRLWFGLKKIGLDPMDLFDWDGTRPPYPGLPAFQEQDAAVYFGRGKDIQTAMETLNRLQHLGGSRLVLVLGASGSGKSSLVRAGVVPRLKRDKDRWLVLEPFRPLGRPFDQLAMVLAGAFASFGNARDWKSIRDALNPAADNAGGAHLLDSANDLRVMAGRREATVLLVVDQFEELLGRDTDPSASLFFRLLKAVLSQPSSPFLAVATLRSDFLGAFQTHEAVQDLLYEPIHLPQMALADFAQVIEGPAKRAGVELEAGLAQAMVADTATDDALPLLAFTLRKLWDDYGRDECLTLKEYRDGLRGLQGSLARAAEAIFAERPLSADEELHLRKAFLSMVRVDEKGRYVRRPVPWTELPEDVHDLIERFVQARLMVSRSKGAERILEAAHDALFRSWDRLAKWLDADHGFLLWCHRLQGDMTKWERTEHDKSTLLRGPVLVEAERWLAERPDGLNQAERKFIQASVALREQERAARERLRRRNRIIALGVIGTLSIAVLLAGWQWWRAEEQRINAESREFAARSLLAADSNPAEALALAIKAGRQGDNNRASDAALRRAIKVSHLKAVLQHDHDDAITDVAVTPDSQRVVTAGRDNQVRIWDARSAELQTSIDVHASYGGPGRGLEQIIVSPDGKRIAAHGNFNNVYVWDLASQNQILTFKTRGANTMHIAFSQDSRKLLAVHGATVEVWNIDDRKELLQVHGQILVHGNFSPDGRFIAAASTDAGVVTLWDADTKEVQAYLSTGTAYRAEFSPDGKWLAAISGSPGLKLWNIEKLRNPTFVGKTFGDRVKCAQFNHDPGTPRLVTCGSDSVVRILEPREKEWVEVGALRGHQMSIVDATFDMTGDKVASASEDGTARIWVRNPGGLSQPPSWHLLSVLRGHRNKVLRTQFSRDGRLLVTLAKDGTAMLWDTGADREAATFGPLWNEVEQVALDPGGRHVVALVKGKAPRICSVENGNCRTLAKEDFFSSSHYGSVVFSPDGKTILTAGPGNEATLYDVASGTLRRTFQGHTDSVVSAEFDKAGKRIVTASHDYTFRTWDAESGEPLIVIQGPKHWPWGASFSPDGHRIISVGWDGIARVWSDAGNLVATLDHGVDGKIYKFQFNPDGRRLITMGGGFARIWDSETWQPLYTLKPSVIKEVYLVACPDGLHVVFSDRDGLVEVVRIDDERKRTVLRGHRAKVEYVAASPDGSLLLTSDHEAAIRLWHPETGSLVLELHDHTRVSDYSTSVVRTSFSANGQVFATGGQDGTIRVYYTKVSDLIKLAHSRLPIHFETEEPREIWPVEASQLLLGILLGSGFVGPIG